MRNLLALLVTALLCTSASAGLYITEEAQLWPPASRDMRLWPIEDGFLRAKQQEQLLYLKPRQKLIGQRIDELRQKMRAGRLTLDDRINLSAYLLIHAEKADPSLAFSVLHRQTQGHFLALSNLSMVHFRNGDFIQAKEQLKEALRQWPTMHPGWTAEQLRFYRRAEQFFLNLIQSRLSEQRNPRRSEEVDEVFPGVSFETRAGRYLIGELPWKSRDALPPDAMKIIQQLRIWLPFDLRLRWLHAELLNAEGDITNAVQMINNFQGTDYPSRKRRLHARALKQASRMVSLLRSKFRLEEQQILLWGLASHSPMTSGAYESLIRAHLASSARSLTRGGGIIPSFPQKPLPKPTSPGGNEAATGFFALPRMTVLLMGIGGGVVIGILLLAQIQSIIRRWKR